MWETPDAMLERVDALSRGDGRQTQRTRQTRRLLATVLGVALVLITASGVALAIYFAPVHTVERFCRAVAAQNEAHAYPLFTTAFQHQYPLAHFTHDMLALDEAEGRETACSSYSIAGLASPDTLTIALTLRRERMGELRGYARLRFENGGWRIDGLDMSLLGVDLGALETASTFCDALQRQDYGAVYTLLAANTLGKSTKQQFTSQGDAWDKIGGKVSDCTVAGVKRGNSGMLTQLTMRVTRTRVSGLGGTMTFAYVNGQWIVKGLDQAVLGDDLGPLTTGSQFCADLSNGKFHDAYMLLSRGLRASLPETDGRWHNYTVPGLHWTCTPDFATYIVKGNSASYVVVAQVTDSTTGKVAKPRLLFTLVQDAGAWRLDNIAAVIR